MTSFIDVVLGDSEVDVIVTDGGWRIYRGGKKGGAVRPRKRLRGVERWIMRSGKRHTWFEEILADAVMP